MPYAFAIGAPTNQLSHRLSKRLCPQTSRPTTLQTSLDFISPPFPRTPFHPPPTRLRSCPPCPTTTSLSSTAPLPMPGTLLGPPASSPRMTASKIMLERVRLISSTAGAGLKLHPHFPLVLRARASTPRTYSCRMSCNSIDLEFRVSGWFPSCPRCLLQLRSCPLCFPVFFAPVYTTRPMPSYASSLSVVSTYRHRVSLRPLSARSIYQRSLLLLCAVSPILSHRSHPIKSINTFFESTSPSAYT